MMMAYDALGVQPGGGRPPPVRAPPGAQYTESWSSFMVLLSVIRAFDLLVARSCVMSLERIFTWGWMVVMVKSTAQLGHTP